jgi:hypothetical protein
LSEPVLRCFAAEVKIPDWRIAEFPSRIYTRMHRSASI